MCLSHQGGFFLAKENEGVNIPLTFVSQKQVEDLDGGFGVACGLLALARGGGPRGGVWMGI